ncbi:MAG: hypothetical protein WBA31_07655 [Candidatus Dormiibacterota bacterium]
MKVPVIRVSGPLSSTYPDQVALEAMLLERVLEEVVPERTGSRGR